MVSMNALLLFTLNLAPLVILAGGLGIGVYAVNAYNARHNRTKYRFYSLTFPSEVRVDQVVDWWISVAATFSHSTLLPSHAETVVIELRADTGGLTHRLGIPWQHTELIDQLRSHIEGIHITEHKLETFPVWKAATEAGVNDNSRQLDVEKIESQARRLLAAAMAELKSGDASAVQLVVNPVGRPKVSFNTVNVFLGGKQPKVDPDQQAKRQQHQFKVVLRVVATAETDPHAQKLVSNLKNAYKALRSSNVHLTATRTSKRKIIQNVNSYTPPVIYPARVSALELTALGTFPIGAPALAGLTLGRTRYLPPNETIPRDGRRLGTSVYDGFKQRPIAITAEGACRHMYVIGASGFGKTTLLANSLQQDIEHGHGAVVLDSKGDLFREGLKSIPRERLDDAIIIDLTDHDHPVGINLLQQGDKREVIDDLIRLFASEGNGDIYLNEMLYHGLHALSYFPELTIPDLSPFLHPRTPVEKAWRDALVDQLPRNGQFYQYWKSHDQLKPSEQLQKIKPVLNRIWQLSNRRDLLNLLGQSKSTVDFEDVIRNNRIMLVYVPDNIGRSTVSLVTTLLTKALWDAAQAVQSDTPTYIYLDEVQKLEGFADLEDMLSLSRSRNIGIVGAHQYTSQLSRTLFSAFTGNASTQVAFKMIDGEEANRIARLMGKSVTPDDYLNLDDYQVIARLATAGGSSQPTVIKTFPRFKTHDLGDEVVRRSRAQFARPASDVDREIARRRSAPDKPAKAKPKFGDMKGDEE